MIDEYVRYLNVLENTLLSKYFEEQRPYLHCKEGCSYCCEAGQYPFSELEFKYLMQGFDKLSAAQKSLILDKVLKIKEYQKNSTEKDFYYECPFLIDKICCVYNHRGLICRTHGLMFFVEDSEGKKSYKLPACIGKGLNYSSVFDQELKIISRDKWKEIGIEVEPNAYNLSLKALMNNEATEEVGLEFGESKALINWFE